MKTKAQLRKERRAEHKVLLKFQRHIHRKEINNRAYRRTKRCPDCGGNMIWCDICEMWSKVCCQDFGSCQCS